MPAPRDAAPGPATPVALALSQRERGRARGPRSDRRASQGGRAERRPRPAVVRRALAGRAGQRADPHAAARRPGGRRGRQRLPPGRPRDRAPRRAAAGHPGRRRGRGEARARADEFIELGLDDAGKFQTVRRLADQGLSAVEIARQTRLGREEVELIMQLSGEARP